METITGNFHNFCKAIPWEEIYIHTDRSDYIAGEEFWFNIYLIDRQSNKPSSLSKIVYLEILNADNCPVVQKRILIENGFGPGNVTLPDTLSTGRYCLRAYTNWMKNFMTGNCFMKRIIIYNAISDMTLKSFSFPVKNLSGNSSHSRSKSEAAVDLKLNVDNSESDSLHVSIIANDNYRFLNQNHCYLLIQTHGIVNLIMSLDTESDGNTVAVSKNILIPGINNITIFNPEGQRVAERFIYTPVRKRQCATVSLADSCRKREHISIELELDKDAIASSNGSDISISVAPGNDNQPGFDPEEYMILGTEFGIFPEEFRNKRMDDFSPQTLDSLLLSLKSNWIDWDIIMSGKIPDLNYAIEHDEHFLTGTLTYGNSGINNAGKYLFLSTPGKNAVFEYAKTNNEGNFYFTLPLDEGAKDLIIQPEETEGEPYIKITSSFYEEYTSPGYLQNVTDMVIPDYILKSAINYQVSKIYDLTSIGDTFPATAHIIKPRRFYGKPDIELIMADYIKLPTMEEVFFELTPGVQLKSKKSEFRMTIANPIDNSPYNHPPVLFIDGVVVNNAAVIGNLDPGIVEKIDAFRSIYMVGDFHFFGLVNIITRAGDFSSARLPDYAVRLRYMVTDKVMSFSSPDYTREEMKKSRIPDFRNTLYWNPSVRPDADGKAVIEFWTADMAGEYEVNLQGLTSKGQPLSIKKIIMVK